MYVHGIRTLFPFPGYVVEKVTMTADIAQVILYAVQRRRSSAGDDTRPATVAPAGSNRSGCGGNEAAGVFGVEGRLGRLGEHAGRNVSERRAGLEKGNAEADLPELQGRLPSLGQTSDTPPAAPPG